MDFWNGNLASVQSFVAATGVTFPVLRNGGYLSSPDHYGIAYDNYVVVDAQGIVRYTSISEIYGALGRFNDAHIRDAIVAHLPVAVRDRTWSAVKSLFR